MDVILRDGSTLRLHVPGPDDEADLIAFFAGLSPRSIYLRFHGVRRVDTDFIAGYLVPDWDSHGVLVGSLEGRIVAVAEYVRLRDARSAEVAFAVADTLHGRGIATRLLEQLAQRAA